MTIPREMVEEAIKRVELSYREKKPIEPFSGLLEAMTQEEAYQIQYGLVERLRNQGQKVIGHKVALTSRAARLQLGIGEPAFGHLMNPGIYLNGSTIPFERFLNPFVEAEVAFLLKHDLQGPNVTPLSVLKATEGVFPAIEVVNLILQGPRLKANDLIAYNALNAGVVLGSQLTPVQAVDLRYEGVALELDGELVGSGAGAEVMGNPVHSVVWLANKLAEFNDFLRAGEIIISGSITSALKVNKGNHVKITFTRLGSVGAKFL